MTRPPEARVVDVDGDAPAELVWRSLALDALSATLDEDHTAAALAIATLADAGVVAIRTPAWILELHETLLGWVLVATRGTPDPHDLATAATIRHARLETQRRAGA